MRADPTYESFSHRHHAYVMRGRYAEQLSVVAKHCGHENLLVLDADAFFARPDEHYRRVLAFLGLRPQKRALLCRRILMRTVLQNAISK